jgi:aldose 1-epimerase
MAANSVAPSGEQLEIGSGDQRAVVVEFGGGLRSYAVGDVDVLDGYGADEMCSSGRGQVLMPWPNRIEDGSYDLDGRRQQLALTEPESGNAIHGLVRWVGWSVAERDADRVAVEHVLHPQPGYPFTLALRIEYALSEDGLAVRTTAKPVEETDFDFREARAIGATKLDNAFTTFSHEDDGLARVALRDPKATRASRCGSTTRIRG